MEIARKIKQLITGNWDAIFVDKYGSIERIRVQAIAVVEEYRVVRDSNRRIRDRQYLWDSVAPVNLNDSCGDEFSIIDRPDYVGLIPAGADPRDPVFGLEFPSNAGRDAA